MDRERRATTFSSGALVVVRYRTRAVSAIAITAITPACSGSVTTRSAASGTLPAMFRLITRTPWRRLRRRRQ